MTGADLVVVVAALSGEELCLRSSCWSTGVIVVYVTEGSHGRSYGLCWLHWRNLVELHAHGGAVVRYDDEAVALLARAN